MTAPEAISGKTLIKVVDMTKATKQLTTAFFGERIPLNGAEKNKQLPPKRDREAIMTSLEQLKLAVSDFPPFVESFLRNYLCYRCDTFNNNSNNNNNNNNNNNPSEYFNPSLPLLHVFTRSQNSSNKKMKVQYKKNIYNLRISVKVIV